MDEKCINKHNYKCVILVSGSEVGVAEIICIQKGSECCLKLVGKQEKDRTLPELGRRKEHTG